MMHTRPIIEWKWRKGARCAFLVFVVAWLCAPLEIRAWAADTNNGQQSAITSTAASGPAQTAPKEAPAWQKRLQDFRAMLTPVLGPWIKTRLFLGISWLQILLSAGALVLAAIVDLILRFLLRRQIRRETARPSTERKRFSWIKPALEATVAPLVLFVWIWGLYAAFSILFAHLEGEQTTFVLNGLAWLNEAGEIVVLFWFLFRMANVADEEWKKWAASTTSKWDDIIAAVAGRAVRLILPLVAAILILPTLHISAASHEVFKEGMSLLLIFAVGFILYEMVNAVEQAVLNQYRIDVKDNLEARKVYTQVKVLKKVAIVVIAIFTVASMLMVFDSVRQLGTSILASAGIAGIILGFAAQRSLSTLLAGLQIAITQPIRLDDVVIVENEWGRIEEITLTYVVVRIWDLRRLIVPINYFIEKPFQNWTRVSADLLGSVMLYVDYTVPLKALRDELDRLLENSKRWDRKVKVIQVTDAKLNGMEVRVLVSAPDASTAWDLRCELREKLIDFVQRNYPQSLPRMRAEILDLRLAKAGAA
ncbi:MAG TPA: mechanosensitive ion channel domain-containing protein [Verrucomicrobiae bacterium]|nr:mechanosensitive ion channel domain-containing protein [Verrucomicrobiae bacterium]